MNIEAYEVFSKKAKYEGGEYLVKINNKILVKDSPLELYKEFEKEYEKDKK